MTPQEAQRVIDALADGADPETGELFPSESVLLKPAVIRALFLASRALEATRRASSAARSQPAQAGKPWTPEEDQRLLDAFDQGADLPALTASHARSKGGIASRLVHLGRIKESAEIRMRSNVPSMRSRRRWHHSTAPRRRWLPTSSRHRHDNSESAAIELD